MLSILFSMWVHAVCCHWHCRIRILYVFDKKCVFTL